MREFQGILTLLSKFPENAWSTTNMQIDSMTIKKREIRARKGISSVVIGIDPFSIS